MSQNYYGKMKLLLLILGGLALALLFSQTNFCYDGYSRPYAKAGMVDLTAWDCKEALKLDGEWEFYWGRLLGRDDILDREVRPNLLVRVPSSWTRYTLDGRRLPGQGDGTYRLKIISNLEQGKNLSLHLEGVPSNYSIMINDKSVANNGLVSSNPKTSRPDFRPQIVNFSVPGGEFDIIIQVSNYHHAQGGLWTSVVLGNSDVVSGLYKRLGDRQVFFAGTLIFIAITYFCLFMFRRKSKEYLYLSLLALDLVVLTSTMYPALMYRFFPDISFHLLIFWSYASVSWTVALSVLLTAEMFPAWHSKMVAKVSITYTGFLTLLYLLTPVNFFTSLSALLNYIGLLFLGYVIYLIGRAVFRGIEGSGPFLFGFLVAGAAFVHDTLLINNYIDSKFGELVYVGIALFLVQAVLQAIKFTKMHDENIVLVEKLHRANQQKDEFMFNTAHQLRSPLTAITIVAEELLVNNELTSQQRKKLSLIKAFGNNAANSVKEMLDYSILKREDASLILELVNLRVVVDNILKLPEMNNELCKGSLVNKVPKGLPMVLADESRIYQIFYALMEKAKQYVQGSVQITATADVDYVTVSLLSRSVLPPFAARTLQRVIENEDDGGRIPASELTLYIIKQLINLHHGTVWTECLEEHGLVLRFTLPVSASNTRAKAVLKSQDRLPRNTAGTPFHYPGKGAHVLVVDDNIGTLNATANILSQNGFAVSAVSDGKKALALITTDPSITVVLLDLMIPEQLGFETSKEIRKLKSNLELPILILTGKSLARSAALALEAGANDFITKPFEREELIARVKTLASLRESVDKAIASEIAFLQAQIKPHFLYNALSVMAGLTISNPQRARDLIMSLSEYLRHRFSFNAQEAMVSLEQEIELVQAYYDIEKARFGARLELQIIADDHPGVIIPRLTLQPLVENAVRHGIYNLLHGGCIKLQVRVAHDRVHISVRDNGVGIEKHKLESLLTNPDQKGIGLANINKRLLRYYGSGLTIDSIPGQGTEVSFMLPLPSKKRGGEGVI